MVTFCCLMEKSFGEWLQAQMEDVLKVIRKCHNSEIDLRDKAVLLTLLDTGIRAAELLALDRDDYAPTIGRLLIRHGKGNKTRAVFCGKDTNRAIKQWLAVRTDSSSALFVGMNDYSRISYPGLRWLVKRRFTKAGIAYRGVHTFRRLFALTMLRNGTDIVSLTRLMGHSTTNVLSRYLAQTDIQLAHRRASPVLNWGL